MSVRQMIIEHDIAYWEREGCLFSMRGVLEVSETMVNHAISC